MFGHQAAALGKREREPVFADLALLVHWVKAGRRPGGQIGRKPLLAHHGFAVFVGLELGFIRGAIELFAFFDEPLAVLLDGGHVFGNFRDRRKRVSWARWPGLSNWP